MKYLDTKGKSLEDSVISVLETNKNNRSDDGEGLDAVQPDAVKKKFKNRKDKDIDNDGDVDDSDKFLHKKRKAISKAIKNERVTDVAVDQAKRDLKHAKLKKATADVKKEGTWHLPDSSKLKAGLKKLMQKPIKLGKEGDDATDTIRSFIGDDELYDDLYAAGMKNPKGDARPIIKKAMKRLGIKEEIELDENFRKLAVMGIGTETKKGAKVGQSMDYYLPKTGDKSTGKIIRVSKDGYEIENDGDLTPRLKGKRHKFKFYDPTSDKTSVRGMRKENYEIGNDYAKHTLRVTPGQLESDVDDMLGIAQKKNLSMRETLAKLWGMTESKNPCEKKVNEKEDEMVKKVTKTMTGKKPTPVEVNPKTGE